MVYQLSTQKEITANPDVDASWCETAADLEAVEQVTYFRRETCPGDAQACQAKLKGELVGGFWSATKQFTESELGINYQLDAGQVWLFAAVIDKQFRNAKAYSSILKFILPALAEQGHVHQIVAVNPDNGGSNYVHKRQSFRSPGTVLAIRFLKTTLCFCFGEIKSDRMIAWNSTKQPIVLKIKTIDEPNSSQ